MVKITLRTQGLNEEIYQDIWYITGKKEEMT